MSISSILIGIAGGTGSGKTSIANKLLEEYGDGDVVVIEQDAYYRDISHIPMKDRHLHNFDHPDAIDIDMEHMEGLEGINDLLGNEKAAPKKGILQRVDEGMGRARRQVGATDKPIQEGFKGAKDWLGRMKGGAKGGSALDQFRRRMGWTGGEAGKEFKEALGGREGEPLANQMRNIRHQVQNALGGRFAENQAPMMGENANLKEEALRYVRPIAGLLQHLGIISPEEHQRLKITDAKEKAQASSDVGALIDHIAGLEDKGELHSGAIDEFNNNRRAAQQKVANRVARQRKVQREGKGSFN